MIVEVFLVHRHSDPDGRLGRIAEQPIGLGAPDEEERDVAVRHVHKHRGASDVVEQGGVLPVPHLALGEPEVEGGQELAELALRHGAGHVGPGDYVLGLQPVVVGEELEGLDLLRADASGAADDVAHGLVARLVDPLGPDEAGVALEVGLPYAPRHGFQQVQPVVMGVRGDGASGMPLHARLYEVRVEAGLDVPPPAVEAGPVSAVAHVGPVYDDVDDQHGRARNPGGLGARCFFHAQQESSLEELDAGDRLSECAFVRAAVHKVLEGDQRLLRGCCGTVLAS